MSSLSKACPLAALLSVGLILTGCAKKYSPDEYSPGGMQQANKADRAVVINVRSVDVNDPSLGLGTAAGAAAGGLAASQIGKGSGNGLAVLGGVLIGGAIGAAVDRDAKSTTAFEYVMEKSSGELITLAQKQDVAFQPGQHVLILYGMQARIIADQAAEAKP
jgi:outer membrane lipoprotein SlyB